MCAEATHFQPLTIPSVCLLFDTLRFSLFYFQEYLLLKTATLLRLTKAFETSSKKDAQRNPVAR